MPAPHHNGPRGAQVHGVFVGSVQHAALRLLAATELTAPHLKGVLADGQAYTARELHRKVLEPLRELGLVLAERGTNPPLWAVTHEGAEVARRLGPFGKRAGAADATAAPAQTDDATPATTISAHSRRRLTLGTGDQRPPKLRPGSDDAAKLPSRMGKWLVWPDGSRTAA